VRANSTALFLFRAACEAHLPANQGINLRSMVLIVSQTFINLRSCQVGKASHRIIDARTVDDQGNHIVYPDSSTLDNRVASAHVWQINQVTVTSRWHGIHANLAKTSCKDHFGEIATVPARQGFADGSALLVGIDALEKAINRKSRVLPAGAGKPWDAEDQSFISDFENGTSIAELAKSHR
jgi:hypothetical protein